MGIRVTPADNKPRLMEYHGIRLWVLHQHSVMRIKNKRIILVSEMGMTEEEYGDLSEQERDKIFGKAFIGTVVTDIEPFEVEEADGAVIEFSFDKPSTMDEYDTMGEELLGEDDALRESVMGFAVTLEHYREDREVRALGNSKAQSDSGGQ